MLFSLLIVLPLTVVVWVVLRLFRERVKSFERLGELIAVVVLFTWLAILFIGLPTYAAVSLIGAHLGLWHSSLSPLVAAMPKWRGLPVILWVFLYCGLCATAAGLFAIVWRTRDWVMNRAKGKVSTAARHSH
jgi:putative effector of murein hydrolase